jgi:hypothetical protein
MNLLLGRTIDAKGKSHFINVAFVPGERISIFDYDEGSPDSSSWKTLAVGKSPDTASGQPISFRVECAPESDSTVVTVRVAGTAIAHATIGRSLDGPWGLGAQGGSSGIWKGVRCVNLAGR